jgi:hypothetical protein
MEQNFIETAKINLWKNPSMVFQDERDQARVHFGELPDRRPAFTMFKLEEGSWIQTGQLAIYGVNHAEYASNQARSYARGKGLRLRVPDVNSG